MHKRKWIAGAFAALLMSAACGDRREWGGREPVLDREDERGRAPATFNDGEAREGEEEERVIGGQEEEVAPGTGGAGLQVEESEQAPRELGERDLEEQRQQSPVRQEQQAVQD